MNSKLSHFYVLEDAPRGDITSQAIFNGSQKEVKAHFLAKQDLVVSGFDCVSEILKKNFPKLKLVISKPDGSKVRRMTVLGKLSGPVQDVLKAERLCLNLLQHLSGIATLTSKFVAIARMKKVQILDTRKTTPGLRQEEKQAVRDGGGVNHRFNLSDQYLIKDNHIQATGSVTLAIQKIQADRKRRGGKEKIEVEVRTILEFKEALALKPDIILLDNLSPAQIQKLVAIRNRVGKTPQLEISGGVTPKNFKRHLNLGVERISIGALTHSAPAVDISLKIK